MSDRLRVAAEAAIERLNGLVVISQDGSGYDTQWDYDTAQIASELRAALAEPVKQREPLTDVEILDLFGLYLEARRYDGRQIHAQTGTVGYDECEWTAFQSAVVQTERAHGIGGSDEHD